MSIKYSILLSFYLVISSFNVSLQGINYRSLVKTYADGSWSGWSAEIAKAEKSLPTDTESKFILVNLYFGYVGHFIDGGKYDVAFEYIHKGEKLIHQILAVEPSNVTAISYKGAFLAFRVGINRIKYLATALEGLSLIYKAYDMDNNNLIAILNKASALYFLPPFFGGNKAETIRLLNYACSLMEKSGDTVDNWMYYYTLIFIGRSNEKTGKLIEAKHAFEKVLQLEPEFKWVQNDLYPAVLKAISGK
jgi:tetratricopeptide (TPR) repeat protein